jgi:hypothetical protein
MEEIIHHMLNSFLKMILVKKKLHLHHHTERHAYQFHQLPKKDIHRIYFSIDYYLQDSLEYNDNEVLSFQNVESRIDIRKFQINKLNLTCINNLI